MDKTNLQSIVFEKRLYNAGKARKWLSANGFSLSEGELHESENAVRFSLRGLDCFEKNTVAGKTIAQGISAVAGKIKAKEAVAAGANSPLLKAKVKEDATISAPLSAGVYKVVLISEGLGNRDNMNFYGPEALATAPAIFEGKPCFINHPSYSEEEDIPERRVESQCGFYKNCRVETIDGLQSLTAELHLESTPQGEYAKQKCDFALLYRREFPNATEEYMGFSVAAAGTSEKRTVAVDGVNESVNYLMQFTGARSCDMVTSAGRGGKVLQFLESNRNLNAMEKKTVMNELHKNIQDALAKLETQLAGDEKADAGIKDAVANLKTLCGGLGQSETPAPEADPKPAEVPAAAPEAPKAEEAKPKAPVPADAEKPVEAPAPIAAQSTPPAPNPVPESLKPPAPAGPEDREDEPMEAQRLAVQFLVNEAGPEVVKVIGTKMPATLKEARTRISDVKATLAIVKESLTPAGNPPKGGAAAVYTPKL